tara:strand:- start:1203 stop:2405 length:1203 start_codon:yes stop_codon:yes gene_type:complete
MPASNIFQSFAQGQQMAEKQKALEFDNQQRERLSQIQDMTQAATQGGIGSQAFKALAGFSPEQAAKLKGILQTDDQGLDAAFQDAAVFKNLLQNDPTGQSALQFGRQRVQAGQANNRNMIHSQRFLDEIQADPQAALGSISSFLSIPQELAGRAKKEVRVQNSRDVPGGTIITYSDGTQEFKKFGEEVNQAALDVTQRDLPKLTSSMQNKQLEFQESANSAYSLADKTSILADRFSRVEAATGAAGSARESFLNFIGGQDEISNLRKDYTRIRNKLITANLPQGPATDKDIELIAAGFPQASASQAQIVDFLQAMSRGQEAVAKFDEFKSTFLQENGNITRATRDFDFKGQAIKKGERLASAYKRISKKLEPKAAKNSKIIGDQLADGPSDEFSGFKVVR